MKKKLLSIGLMLCIISGLCACKSNDGTAKMTDEYRRILTLSGMDEEEVANNKVTDEEQLLIDDYEFAKEYFNKKYGISDDLSIDFVVGMNDYQDYTYFGCSLKSDSMKAFEIDVYNEDTKYARDDYYGILMSDSYAEFVKGILKENNLICTEAELYIHELYGEEFNKDLTPEEAIKNGKMVNGVGTLYFDGEDDAAALRDVVEDVLRENNITGSFAIELNGLYNEVEWVTL